MNGPPQCGRCGAPSSDGFYCGTCRFDFREVEAKNVALTLDVNALKARVAALRPLAAFGAGLIEGYFGDSEFNDLDGGFVQEKAVELGLLIHPETAHDPDECEHCAEEPRSCYVLSAAAVLKGLGQ